MVLAKANAQSELFLKEMANAKLMLPNVQAVVLVPPHVLQRQSAKSNRWQLTFCFNSQLEDISVPADRKCDVSFFYMFLEINKVLKKIIAGYSVMLVNCAKILLLVALCVGFAFLIVWPLWKCATSSPKIYTIIVAVVAVTALIGFALVKLHTYLNAKGLTVEEKSERRRGILLVTAKTITIISGIVGSSILVMNSQRFIAVCVLIVMIIVYGILAFGTKKSKKGN